ncbi:MAG: hypothetical protein KTR19_02450 [Hyphomicrobiales bacterium]|nr:hypothetical protein [Hyphomicrobiales bacterium]
MSYRNDTRAGHSPAIITLIISAAVLLASFAAMANEPAKHLAPSETETRFLDRLMKAESGGRLNAKNPRSSALGPFQFIESTFYEVVTRHLPKVAEDKSYVEIQKLRTDLAVSRSAALAYTRQNAAFLDKRGIKPEAGFLRLAFLVGPHGAAKVISAEPDTLLSELLSSSALAANPFMKNMNAKQLINRAKREADGLKPLPVVALNPASASHPKIKVRCNLKLASCRKWLFLAKKRLARQ